MPVTFRVTTFGCQMNSADANILKHQLIDLGAVPAEREPARFEFIMTCCVRKSAENRPRALLRQLISRKKNGHGPPVIVFMGCMAQYYGDSLRREFPALDYILGTCRFPLIYDIVQERLPPGVYVDMSGYSFLQQNADLRAVSAYVSIIHGCSNFCSYCIVPHVRGPEISRPVRDIVDEINAYCSLSEVTLLGQNVNSYGLDRPGELPDFPEMLRVILRETSVPWVRFLTSHPKDCSRRLFDLIGAEKRVCPQLHLPVQSGSSRVLREMNRAYTREDYLQLVNDAVSAVPGISLSTDVIVGYPGETEEDFQQTLDLMKEVRYQEAFMYIYNHREGTRAAKQTGAEIDHAEKINRLQRLIDTQNEVTREKLRQRVGDRFFALLTKKSKKDERELVGHNAYHEQVVLPADTRRIGEFVRVEAVDVRGRVLRTREVETLCQ